MSNHHHSSHSHTPQTNFSTAFLISIALNAAFVIIELSYGFVSNSVALIADATHNLGDVLGLALGFIALKLASRIPNQKFTYGYKSSTILATLVSGSLLLLAVIGIIWEAIQKLNHPEPVEGWTIITVALAGVLVNAISAYLLSKGKKDLNVKSAFMHLLSDAVVSVGVAFSGIIVLVTGFVYTDSIVSLIIGIVIFVSTIELFKEAVSLSLQGVPKDVDIFKIRTMLENSPDVIEVHDLHVWGMSTSENALTCHLVIKEGVSKLDLVELSYRLEHDFNISHSTIQLESKSERDKCKLLSDTVV